MQYKIESLNKVGAVTAKRLKKLGLNTLEDLLFYFPFRYDDFSEITPIAKLEPNTTANIVGQIELIQNKRSYRKRMFITEALISDDTESIKIIWFNQPYIGKTLKVGDKVSLSGKVEGALGETTMKSPSYEKIITDKNVHTQGLVPNYHLTANITQKQIRFLIKQIIDLADDISEWLTPEIIKSQNLMSINEALRNIHFPATKENLLEAKRRLGFDELFLVQLQSQLIKQQIGLTKSPKINFKEKETKDFVDSLPFKLTDAQKKSSWQIIQDMEKEKPMSRLLEGDVGSGKTMVAVIAMLNASKNNLQSSLMVPTEILAKQHFQSISKLLSGTKASICLLTRTEQKISGKNEKISKKEILKKINNGEIDIIIGTHSLIQDAIEFKNLGLVIIDEQHRFGVEQRKKIIEKSGDSSTSPHLLSMTATPIPRSLALILYGDLDLSIINEMPLGRKPINTQIIPEPARQKAYEFIKKEITKGRQAFVICPLIDPSDKLGVKSAKEEFEKLNTHVFKELNISLLHGRLKAEEKEKIMKDFQDNKINILVSTSVVEVGVDIPNASIMMIEGADRFGLAQLHQFRGRVGRGEHQSYCLLFTDNTSPNTLERLGAMTKYSDGFTLSKIDLKQRGPGEVYGKSQKGFPEFKIANLFDHELIQSTQEEAENLIKIDPELKNSSSIYDKIKDWQKNIHLE